MEVSRSPGVQLPWLLRGARGHSGESSPAQPSGPQQGQSLPDGWDGKTDGGGGQWEILAKMWFQN